MASTTGTKVFTLFPNLSDELKVSILEHAVPKDSLIKITPAGFSDFGSDSEEDSEPHAKLRTPEPPITRVSRLFRAETLKAYYTKNHFQACYCVEFPWAGEVFMKWLRAIGAEKRGLIKSLYVKTASEEECVEQGCWDSIEKELVEEMGACVTEDNEIAGNYWIAF